MQAQRASSATYNWMDCENPWRNGMVTSTSSRSEEHTSRLPTPTQIPRAGDNFSRGDLLAAHPSHNDVCTRSPPESEGLKSPPPIRIRRCKLSAPRPPPIIGWIARILGGMGWSLQLH